MVSAPLPTCSVIVLTHGRAQSLRRCLAALFEEGRSAPFEVLVVVNGADAATLEVIRGFEAKRQELRSLVLEPRSKGRARNRAIEEARGAFLYFLDDDAIAAGDVVRLASELFRDRPDIGVAGGPNLTPVAGTLFQRVCGQLLASRFGAGAMRYRYRPHERAVETDDTALILCNLAVRRSALADLRFDERLVCNEENLLLHRLRRRGVRMLHAPQLAVWHERRRTPAAFFRQVFRSGRGRMQQSLRAPRSLRPGHLLPALLVLYLVWLPFAPYFPLGWGPLGSYGILAAASAAAGALSLRRPLAFPLLLVGYPLAHMAYGLGFLLGWLPAPLQK